MTHHDASSAAAARLDHYANGSMRKAIRIGTNAVRTRDGTQLFCQSWGEGRAVVLLHSWGFSSRMWTYQTTYLSDRGMQCITYDRRGHGRSDQPAHGYDMETLADDLADVLEAHDVRKAVLIGHSMGGAEILRYAGRHGLSRVSKIVLLAPMTPFFMQTPDNPHGAPADALAQVRDEWMRDFPGWIARNKQPFFVPETSPAMMDWLIRELEQMALPVAIACNKSLVETDLRGDLSKIDCPTLVLHGDVDASTPLEITGRPTAEGIDGAILKIYAGAPHGLFLTHKDQVNRDIAAFIEGTLA